MCTFLGFPKQTFLSGIEAKRAKKIAGLITDLGGGDSLLTPETLMRPGFSQTSVLLLPPSERGCRYENHRATHLQAARR